MKYTGMRTAAVVLTAGSVAVFGATITIDKAAQYQAVEGLGAGIHYFQTWKVRQGPFYIDADMDALGFYDTVVSQLGITEIRSLEDGYFSPSAGVFAPTDYVKKQMTHMRKFREAALRQGEPMLFMTSVLSPPGYMKVSGISEGLVEAAPNYNTTDCRLLDGYDDDYAQFVVRYLQTARDSIGVETHAWSIQNEPAFQEPYPSCVYNGARYVSVLKATAAAVANAGLTTGFFGGEHMSWSFPNPFEAAVRSDATALAAMHAWAVHGYTDGVHADTGSFGGSTPTDKPLWMSETSGSSFGSSLTDWSGAMTLARQIHGYLRAGRISLWNFLHIMVSGNPADAAGSALYSDGQMTAKAYASAHFYRYIRPGARQVSSTSSDNNVAVVAFWHETNQCLSLVLMNNSGGPLNVTAISGTDLPSQFEMVTSTDATKNARSTVSRTSTIALPAQSITTLVSGAYRNTLPVQVAPERRVAAAAAPRAAAGTATPARTYACDGRRVRGTTGGVSGGVFLTRRADGRTSMRVAVGR